MEAPSAGPRGAPKGTRGDVRALSWNIYHGRDFPPDPALFTVRSRLLGRVEHNDTHVQVNRSLLREFAQAIAEADWQVCLLQEAPPAWSRDLARASGAACLRVLTSRNQLGPLRQLGGRWNPDLVGSNEGGSNVILVRPPLSLDGPGRSLLLNPLGERGLGERRRMAFARLRSPAGPFCVGCLHASTGPRWQTEREVIRAARAAVWWARGAPLILGGDFNLRPQSSGAFDRVDEDLGLRPPTGPNDIDHLLARGMEPLEPPRPWPARRREVIVTGAVAERRLRLSDHAPVEALFRLQSTSVR